MSSVRNSEGISSLYVGLDLVERAVERGVFVAGVLQFDHGQWQAVYKQYHVGPAVALPLDYRELVCREPVIGLDVAEVDQPGDIAAEAAVLSRKLDWYAFDEVAVQAAVFLDE